MIQIIRRSALEEADVRQHEPRPSPDPVAKPRKGLSSLVQDYVDKAEYVGKVTGHGSRKEKTEASHRAAATNGRPQDLAYPSAGLLPVDWTREQTTTPPPPDQRSGAMGHYHHQQQQQHHMQHGLTASPAAYAAMSGFGLHDPRPPIAAASARPIADAAMATVMAPSGGPVGPWGRMAHHSPPLRVSAAGLGPVQPASGYAMPGTTNANIYLFPPGYEASSAQQHQLHHPYAGVAPSPFPGHLQMAMPAGRRGSLPDRRLMARERAAPYSLAYRMPSERKGSV